DRRARLATSYEENAETGELELYDAPDGEWSRPPVLESGAAGLVSTADDVLAFYRMLLDGGRGPRGRLLARPSVEAMTRDQLEPDHRKGAEVFFGETCSWGLGMGVVIRRHAPPDVPGRFGWDGGLGCSAWADPKEQLVGILLTQRAVSSPAPPPIYQDFWTSVYQAIDD
ncbi:MAG: serine hydrolase, partial [Deltaproteobacteria bacterium]|nr:serine hydrolase [Nannocystaceae bacterium]